MSDAWKDRERAQEESYFQKQEKEALAKLKDRSRKSPITGEPMEVVTIEGITVDRCKSSGGIWLDSGELEQILKNQAKAHTEKKHTWLGDFLSKLVTR